MPPGGKPTPGSKAKADSKPSQATIRPPPPRRASMKQVRKPAVHREPSRAVSMDIEMSIAPTDDPHALAMAYFSRGAAPVAHVSAPTPVIDICDSPPPEERKATFRAPRLERAPPAPPSIAPSVRSSVSTKRSSVSSVSTTYSSLSPDIIVIDDDDDDVPARTHKPYEQNWPSSSSLPPIQPRPPTRSSTASSHKATTTVTSAARSKAPSLRTSTPHSSSPYGASPSSAPRHSSDYSTTGVSIQGPNTPQRAASVHSAHSLDFNTTGSSALPPVSGLAHLQAAIARGSPSAAAAAAAKGRLLSPQMGWPRGTNEQAQSESFRLSGAWLGAKP